MEHVNSDVRDNKITDRESNFMAGGQLFWQYLPLHQVSGFIKEKQEAIVAASGQVIFSYDYYTIYFRGRSPSEGLRTWAGQDLLAKRTMHWCTL